jgi:hypothetical protein
LSRCLAWFAARESRVAAVYNPMSATDRAVTGAILDQRVVTETTRCQTDCRERVRVEHRVAEGDPLRRARFEQDRVGPSRSVHGSAHDLAGVVDPPRRS